MLECSVDYQKGSTWWKFCCFLNNTALQLFSVLSLRHEEVGNCRPSSCSALEGESWVGAIRGEEHQCTLTSQFMLYEMLVLASKIFLGSNSVKNHQTNANGLPPWLLLAIVLLICVLFQRICRTISLHVSAKKYGLEQTEPEQCATKEKKSRSKNFKF